MARALRWRWLGPGRWDAQGYGVRYEVDCYDNRWWPAVWSEEQDEDGPVLVRRGLGTTTTLQNAKAKCQLAEEDRRG